MKPTSLLMIALLVITSGCSDIQFGGPDRVSLISSELQSSLWRCPKPSLSNWAPTVSTQAAWPGEVDVPQIAYFRIRASVPPRPVHYFTVNAAYCPAL
jgi:hypothetical protein